MKAKTTNEKIYLPFEFADDRLNYIDASQQGPDEAEENDVNEFTADARVELQQGREVYAAAARLINALLEETSLDPEAYQALDDLATNLTNNQTGEHTGYNDCEVCERIFTTTELTHYHSIRVCKECHQSKIQMDKEEREAERERARKVINHPYLEFTDEETAAQAIDELDETKKRNIKMPYARIGTAIFFYTINDQHQAIRILKRAGMSGLEEQRHPL